MTARNNRFPKSQRLCSRYLIDKLFEPGNSRSLTAYPLRLVYRISEKQCSAETGVMQETKGYDSDGKAMLPDSTVLISVPKRCFKHAVDRNHVKRQVREAYRTNRALIVLPEGKHADMAMIWLDSRHHSSAEVTEKVQNLLRRMSEGAMKIKVQQ